jgi:hypothetical protein
MERKMMTWLGAPEVKFGWLEWVVLAVTGGAMATYLAPYFFGFALVVGVM